jgi:hypothetical protein
VKVNSRGIIKKMVDKPKVLTHWHFVNVDENYFASPIVFFLIINLVCKILHCKQIFLAHKIMK